jgi:hypothetical protein
MSGTLQITPVPWCRVKVHHSIYFKNNFEIVLLTQIISLEHCSRVTHSTYQKKETSPKNSSPLFCH